MTKSWSGYINPEIYFKKLLTSVDMGGIFIKSLRSDGCSLKTKQTKTSTNNNIHFLGNEANVTN
jgi:hypothetical protein